MPPSRLEQQLQFIFEIDDLKQIFRQTVLLKDRRRENDAEHSWHLAMMALFLAEHSNDPVDAFRVVRMVLIHDLVEIDAGDTYCYDEAGYLHKEEREKKAADRIFNLLPNDQAKLLFDLWKEFEDGKTPESRFANALDRFQPLMHNLKTQGQTWKEHGIRLSQVFNRNKKIALGSQTLWNYVSEKIQEAVQDGILPDDSKG